MKKILWIVLLIILIVGIVLFFLLVKPNLNKQTNDTNINFGKTEASVEKKEIKDKEYIEIKLEDGILYALNGNKVEADMTIGDSYYDTTITDMYINPEDYYNKNIQIEGMYLENEQYKFVGRYSTSNLCPYCPQGYSYIEYQLDGKIEKNFTDTIDWIKVIGTLEKGNDETSNHQDYYYLKVLNIELMNERGRETIEN